MEDTTQKNKLMSGFLKVYQYMQLNMITKNLLLNLLLSITIVQTQEVFV